MSRREISLVVGTAGHIDHGKTELVKAMTGIDCDRLLEEKKRGITIELGFAPLILPSERVISLVDVPGHDRFIRQMVSGASGVDAVLFVVAADEGIMPQTREHLDILCLLGIQHGVIAVTKKDLVDEEVLSVVDEDVRTLVEGTFLEDAPILFVSAVTGEGVSALKDEMDRLVDRVKPRERSGAYFMPIDRTFSVAGFGTVVTGTSYKGTVSPGEEVEVYPSGLKSRVRSVQVHGQNVEKAFAGQRVAMCLNDLDLDEIKRGDVVCATNVYKATSCLDVMMKLLPSAPEPLVHWQRVRLHIGTSDVLARISMLDGRNLRPGQSAPVQLVLEEPVVATIGQRFIIRFYSPLRTIGGGEVLIPYANRPSGKKHRETERDRIFAHSRAKNREERIVAILNISGSMTVKDLTVQVQERRQDILPVLTSLEEQGKLIHIQVGDGVVFSPEKYEGEVEKLRTALWEFHKEFPHQNGLAPEALVNKVFPEDERKSGRVILNRAIGQGQFKFIGDVLALPKFNPVENTAYSKNREKLMKYCSECGFQLPALEELPGHLSMTKTSLSGLLDQMKKNNEIAILDGQFVLLLEVLKPLLAKLQEIGGGFTLAQVRDLTGSSRKFVLPILEYLDGKGITRRVAEKRILLKKI